MGNINAITSEFVKKKKLNRLNSSRWSLNRDDLMQPFTRFYVRTEAIHSLRLNRECERAFT